MRAAISKGVEGLSTNESRTRGRCAQRDRAISVSTCERPGRLAARGMTSSSVSLGLRKHRRMTSG